MDDLLECMQKGKTVESAFSDSNNNTKKKPRSSRQKQLDTSPDECSLIQQMIGKVKKKKNTTKKSAKKNSSDDDSEAETQVENIVADHQLTEEKDDDDEVTATLCYTIDKNGSCSKMDEVTWAKPCNTETKIYVPKSIMDAPQVSDEKMETIYGFIEELRKFFPRISRNEIKSIIQNNRFDAMKLFMDHLLELNMSREY